MNTYTHQYTYSYIRTFMYAYFTYTHIETYRDSCHIPWFTHTAAPSSSCRPHTHNSTRAFRNRCSFFFFPCCPAYTHNSKRNMFNKFPEVSLLRKVLHHDYTMILNFVKFEIAIIRWQKIGLLRCFLIGSTCCCSSWSWNKISKNHIFFCCPAAASAAQQQQNFQILDILPQYVSKQITVFLIFFDLYLWQARRAAAADSHELLRVEHASRLAFRQRIQVATIYIRVDTYIWIYVCMFVYVYMCVCVWVCVWCKTATNCCVSSVRYGVLSESGFRWRLYICIHIYIHMCIFMNMLMYRYMSVCVCGVCVGTCVLLDSYELLRVEHASRPFRQRNQVATICICVRMYICIYMHERVYIYECVCVCVSNVRQPRTAACGAYITAFQQRNQVATIYMRVHM